MVCNLKVMSMSWLQSTPSHYEWSTWFRHFASKAIPSRRECDEVVFMLACHFLQPDQTSLGHRRVVISWSCLCITNDMSILDIFIGQGLEDCLFLMIICRPLEKVHWQIAHVIEGHYVQQAAALLWETSQFFFNGHEVGWTRLIEYKELLVERNAIASTVNKKEDFFTFISVFFKPRFGKFKSLSNRLMCKLLNLVLFYTQELYDLFDII